MSLFRPRRNTVTPEMRAEFARMMAAAPTQEQVIAGIHRVTESVIRMAETTAARNSYSESGAAHELEFYGGER